MSQFDSVLLAAKELPDQERMRLIDELFETLPESAQGWPDDMDAELDRRIAEVEQGNTKGTLWSEIRDEA